MAYSALPTRSSADVNLSADVNQLQTNITDTRGRLGTWDSSLSYVIDEHVQYSGSIYKALTNNSNKQPDTNPSDWRELSTDEAKNLRADSGDDINIIMGGDIAARIVSFKNASETPVASLTATGVFTISTIGVTVIENTTGADMEIRSDSGKDLIFRTGDSAGSNKFSFADFSE